MSPHAATWTEVSDLLRHVRNCLASNGSTVRASSAPPTALTATLGQFEEFLEHNELELSWDTLAEIAEKTNAPVACWQKLAHAARLMQLSDKADRAARRAVPVVSSDQALAIARRDAETVYKELLDQRITICLESDGWHVDYELKDRHMHGGGPHYVIDAATGTILTKRYEQ
jgi:hypothetical protein